MSLEDFRLISLILASWGAVLSTINYMSARSNKVDVKVFRRSPRADAQLVTVVVHGRGSRSFVQSVTWKVKSQTGMRIVKHADVLEFCTTGATKKYDWDASDLNNEETVFVEVVTGGEKKIHLSSRDPSAPRGLNRLLLFLGLKKPSA